MVNDVAWLLWRWLEHGKYGRMIGRSFKFARFRINVAGRATFGHRSRGEDKIDA